MGYGTKTLCFVIVAAALAAMAVFLRPGASVDAIHDDQGQSFFPRLTNVADAAEIEVRTMDRLTGAIKVLEMRRRDGKLLITSHEDYPADMWTSLDRLPQFISLKREVVVTDAPNQHANYGVLDPTDPKARGREGTGRRYTFLDAGGLKLADVIIGKEVPNRPGFCYARVPDVDRVYETAIDLKMSYPVGQNNWLDSDFADWIDIDPMKFSEQQITSIRLNRYDVEERQQVQEIAPGFTVRGGEEITLVGREVVVLDRNPEKSTWSLRDMDTANEELLSDVAAEIARSIDTLTIEGATRKPEILTELEAAGKLAAPIPADKLNLPRGGRVIPLPTPKRTVTGFILDPNSGTVFSNLGEVIMELNSGLRYVIRIGELSHTFGQGEGDASTPATTTTSAGQVLRYVMLEVDYDDALMPEPTVPVRPQILIDDDERKKAEATPKPEGASPPSPDGSTPPKPEGDTPNDQETPDPAIPVQPATDAPAAPTDGVVAPPVVDPAAEEAKRAHEEAVRKASNDYSQAMSKYTSERESWEKKKKENSQRMQELRARYKDWIFLMSEDLMSKLQTSRADLVKPKATNQGG